jgi:KDO2-lipid IV(A) lauroyltransferase
LRGAHSTLLRLYAALPLPLLHFAGAVLGALVYLSDRRYREKLEANLQQAGFGATKLRWRVAVESGKGVVEMPVAWGCSDARITRLVKRVDGWQLLQQARDAGRGVLLLTPHLGGFEFAAQYIAARVPLTILYRRPKIACLEPFLRRGLERTRLHAVPADRAGVRSLLKALRGGGAIGMLPDQVPVAGSGRWSDFFGRPAYTISLAGRLLGATSALPLLVVCRRLAWGGGFHLSFTPADGLRGADETADCAALNAAIEALARSYPEQYFWGYNRYKTPAGAAPPAA